MSDFDDDKKLNPEDQALWDEFTRDLRQNEDEEEVESFEALLSQESQASEDKSTTESVSDVVPEVNIRTQNKAPSRQQPAQIDKRTEEKLRKGRIPIEGRLDLHGMTRAVAYEALENFIIGSYNRGLRLVIVITGKGKSKSTSEDWLKVGAGVLKTNVPLWLGGAKLSPYVLKYINAQPKDGGTGALYVYIKRNRG